MNERKRKETGSNLDSLHSRTPSCNRPNCEGEERKLRSCINWLNDNVRLMQKYIENLVFLEKKIVVGTFIWYSTMNPTKLRPHEQHCAEQFWQHLPETCMAICHEIRA